MRNGRWTRTTQYKEYIQQLWQVMWDSAIHYVRHKCPVMAAGMSFFGIVSLIPLTLIGVSTLGYIVGSSESAQQFVSRILSKNFPKSAEEILNQIHTIIASPERSIINGLGLLGLIWSGMRFFNILQSVLNSIWVGATQRKFLWGRATAFLAFVAAGMFFWVSFAFSWAMAAIRELDIGGVILSSISRLWISGILVSELWFVMEYISPLIASMVIIFLVYLLVPHAKVSLRSAILGSAFSASLLELSKWGFGFIIMRFSNYGTVYGPLAGIIIFMMWLYVSMSILLLGAELGSQFQQAFFSKDLI